MKFDVELLKKAGWSSTQSTALFELISEIAPDGLLWGSDGKESEWRGRRLLDYCSSHNKQDPCSLHGQLNFLEYDLRNCHNKLYTAMCDTHDKKKSVEEVKAAVQVYFDRLKEGMDS